MSDYDDAAKRAAAAKKVNLEQIVLTASGYGGVYRPLPVTEQPEIRLERWTVWQLPDGDHHFMGSIPWADGRVSSRIAHYDIDRMIGTTSSGRHYELLGSPGMSQEGLYVWAIWCKRNGLDPDEAVNVSEQYLNKELVERQYAEFRAKHPLRRSDEDE